MFSLLFDPINISLVITALLNFSLGVLIFISGKNKKINIVYSLNIVAIISWIITMFFYRSAPKETSLLWCTILYITPTLIASSFLYFTYIFPSQKEKYIWWRTILIFGINLAIIVMIIWPGFVIKEVNIRPGQEKEIIFTQYYWFYFLYTLSFFSFGFLRLFIKHFKNRGIERLQIIYLVTGYSLAANLAFATNLIMPWIGFFFLNWLGQVFTCIMVAFTTYAILKYRLMDIRIVVKKTIVYFLSAGFVYGMFYLVTWIYNKSFGGIYNKGAYVLGLIVAPLFVVLFVWVSNKIKIIANKYLFFSLYSHQETIAKLTDELTNSIDLDKIVDSIVNSIKQSMQLDRAGVLLINQDEGAIKYKIAKVIGFNESNGISLVQDNFLTQHLEKTQKPLVRDELQMVARDLGGPIERQKFFQLSENMKHIEASLCLPMVISNKLIGIIVLGSKISGDAYTKEDLDLLATLSKQAAIAVDNARLYREVQDFNRTLQQKVDEQTKDIKQAYEIEKQAHEELKKVDESKTSFMMVTQHHLRTPLSVNMGYLDLLMKGTYGRIPKKAIEIIQKTIDSTQKEIRMVNEMLSVSQFQMGKGGVMLRDRVSLSEILMEIVSDLKLEADKKGIYLNLETADEIPEIPSDKNQLKMALENIVDNAIKYTDKGGVAIKVKTGGKKLKIEIKDTGVGITPENQKNLFDKAFQRSKEAWSANATGKGIGLYLSSKIIEAHKGKIWAESEGEGKGTTFYIELPAG
jgi:signal transduction histidine kinase